MTEYFNRDGTPFTGKVHGVNERLGSASYTAERICSRCGGAGGSDKWAHTGWTCFDCGGSGRRGTREVMVYTAAKLEKLQAAGAKRAVARAAKAQAKAEAAQAEADARLAAFEAEHAELLAAARRYAEADQFIADVLKTATARAAISEAQAEAINGAIARAEKLAARKRLDAASEWAGTVGDRLELDVAVNHVAVVPVRSFTGFGMSNLYIASMRGDDGNVYVAKGSSFCPDKGSRLRIRGTVKDHTTYRDTKQTVLSRVAVLEVLEAGPE